MKYIAKRIWRPEDVAKLKDFVERGVSPMRAAAHFRRSIGAVQERARLEGFPFPDRRVVRRERQEEKHAT